MCHPPFILSTISLIFYVSVPSDEELEPFQVHSRAEIRRAEEQYGNSRGQAAISLPLSLSLFSHLEALSSLPPRSHRRPMCILISVPYSPPCPFPPLPEPVLIRSSLPADEYLQGCVSVPDLLPAAPLAGTPLSSYTPPTPLTQWMRFPLTLPPLQSSPGAASLPARQLPRHDLCWCALFPCSRPPPWWSL